MSEDDAAYQAEREAAQRRKIELSIQRKVGRASLSPEDRQVLDPTPARAVRGYDPRSW